MEEVPASEEEDPALESYCLTYERGLMADTDFEPAGMNSIKFGLVRRQICGLVVKLSVRPRGILLPLGASLFFLKKYKIVGYNNVFGVDEEHCCFFLPLETFFLIAI